VTGVVVVAVADALLDIDAVTLVQFTKRNRNNNNSSNIVYTNNTYTNTRKQALAHKHWAF